MLSLDPAVIVKVVPAILIALTVHELAHAFVAIKLGDESPREAGRLTLNPLRHIDPIGFIMLLVAGFGWAKPVRISWENLKHPRRDDTLIALAGPASNLLLAFVLAVMLRLALPFLSRFSQQLFSNVTSVFMWFIWINLSLAVFNLLPIPPLDGSHAIMNLLSVKSGAAANRFFRYGSLVLLALIVADRIFEADLLPIGPVIRTLFNALLRFLGLG
jgi:Zn-dependent protease